MKKKEKTRFAAITAAIFLVLTGCTQHVHVFSEEWTYDETHHWHAATCEHTTEVSKKEPHTWDEGVVTTPATEDVDGVRTFTCTVCGKTKTEAIAALNHTHTFAEEWSFNETNHWHSATCAHTSETLDMGTHVWNDGEITTEPTDDEDGVKTFTCTTCGKTMTEIVLALKHTHTISEAWTSNSKYHWHEADCGIEDHNKDKAEHDWNNGEITTEPTDSEDGVKTFTCTVCERTKTTVIPALNHTHIVSREWTYDTTNHWHEADCGIEAHYEDKDAHSWDQGVVTTEATEDKDGEKTFTCTVCGMTKAETIIASGHTHKISKNWTYDDTSHWHVADCGIEAHSTAKETHDWDVGTITKAATENEDGEKTYTCTICKKTRKESIPALNHSHTVSKDWKSDEYNHWHEADCGIEAHNTDKAAHSWNVGEITKPATDNDDGEKTFTCTICKKTKTEVIPALSHTHTITTEWSSDATNHWHTADCGIETHNTDKAEHSWDEGKVTAEPSCTETGVKTFTCTVCGNKSKTEEIPALGHTIGTEWESDDANHWHTASCEIESHTGKAAHTWNDGEITKAATENEDGEKTYTCTICNKTKKESIPALKHSHTIATEWTSNETSHWHKADCGIEEHNADTASHTWDDGVVKTPATCAAEGEMTYTCSVCKATKTGKIDKTTDHSWGEAKITKAATCKEEGETTAICSVCGEKDIKKIDKLTTHTWGEAKITKAATCKEEGETTAICSVCGEKDIKKIDKLTTHTWGEAEVTKAATCKEEGETTAICSVCGEKDIKKIDKTTEHTWDEGKVEDGVKKLTCTVCGEKKTATVSVKFEITFVSGDIAITNNGNTFTATLDGASNFTWYFNKEKLSETSGTCNLTEKLKGLSAGYYRLMVTAEKNGVTYSSSCDVIVSVSK